MLQVRKSEERGKADQEWLRSRHTFSFGDYHDPQHIRFGPLRVINEDWIAPGQGFGMHGHRDMEIVTYVLDGRLAHRDSMGNGSALRYGDVQRMSAGAGVQHSEYNVSQSHGLHLLQIWIEPDKLGIAPAYQERHFTTESKIGQLRLLASPDGRAESITLQQDVLLYAAIVRKEDDIDHPLRKGRQAYLQVARGQLSVNGIALVAGDGLKITQENTVKLHQAQQAEVLFFDLPEQR